MTDLDRLIDAVEAGADGKTILYLSSRAINPGYAHASNAYNGDLNAAKRLHDALLPGWAWQVTRGKYDSDALVQRDIMAGEHISADHPADPARAWLLSILKAYRKSTS